MFYRPDKFWWWCEKQFWHMGTILHVDNGDALDMLSSWKTDTLPADFPWVHLTFRRRDWGHYHIEDKEVRERATTFVNLKPSQTHKKSYEMLKKWADHVKDLKSDDSDELASLPISEQTKEVMLMNNRFLLGVYSRRDDRTTYPCEACPDFVHPDIHFASTRYQHLRSLAHKTNASMRVKAPERVTSKTNKSHSEGEYKVKLERFSFQGEVHKGMKDGVQCSIKFYDDSTPCLLITDGDKSYSKFLTSPDEKEVYYGYEFRAGNNQWPVDGIKCKVSRSTGYSKNCFGGWLPACKSHPRWKCKYCKNGSEVYIDKHGHAILKVRGEFAVTGDNLTDWVKNKNTDRYCYETEYEAKIDMGVHDKSREIMKRFLKFPAVKEQLAVRNYRK